MIAGPNAKIQRSESKLYAKRWEDVEMALEKAGVSGFTVVKEDKDSIEWAIPSPDGKLLAIN